MIQPILDRKVVNVTSALEQHLLRNGQHTDVAIKVKNRLAGCVAEAVPPRILSTALSANLVILLVTEGCVAEAAPPLILSTVYLLKKGRPTDMAATTVIVKESNLLLRPVAGKDLLPLIDSLVGPHINGMRCC